MIRFIISLPPVSKKNSQQILINHFSGKPFIMPSKKYKEYEKKAGVFVKPLGIDIPVNIECHFFMPTKRRVDLTNLLESIDDVLVKYGCIADDNFNIVVGHDGSRVHKDREFPRTEIIITDAVVIPYLPQFMHVGNGFRVIDKKTGEYPDVGKIAQREEWAQHLCWCDIDGFYIGEDGSLMLADDCGRCAWCPEDRFDVIFEEGEKR